MLNLDRFVVLDAGPLGLATGRPNRPEVLQCLAWVGMLDAAGVRLVVPEIADYEIRRELIRAGAAAGIARLDHFIGGAEYDPITTVAMRQAAHFWAIVRGAGLPTADPQSLDGDCILAAQAWLLGIPGAMVTVATTNVRHIARFPGIDARDWTLIQP